MVTLQEAFQIAQRRGCRPLQCLREKSALRVPFLRAFLRTAPGLPRCAPTWSRPISITRRRASFTPQCCGGRRRARPASACATAAANRPGGSMRSSPMLPTVTRSPPLLFRGRRTSGNSYDAQGEETLGAAAARLYAPQAARRRALGLLFHAAELGALKPREGDDR